MSDVLCVFRLQIMSNGDRLRAMGQCLQGQRTAEEIREEKERILRKVEKKKAELARLEIENEIYEANAWKLEVDAGAKERASNVR